MRLLGLTYVYDHHMPSAKCGERSRPDCRGGLFAPEERDDVLKQANVGVFYIWGANAAKWDTFCVLARAFPRLLILARNTPRPFIYKIAGNGRFIRVPIDGRRKRQGTAPN
jgi:hypothetical protein